jgi:hypothetical protein
MQANAENEQQAHRGQARLREEDGKVEEETEVLRTAVAVAENQPVRLRNF